MTLALVFAASLVMAAPPADGGPGEPLPPGAPTDSYELASWCYGALDEYLQIYEKVIPDLKAIDREFGTDVKEAQPYHTDMAAARVELKMIGDSVTAAEKASPTPITDRGAAALAGGRQIWSVAEGKPHRDMARAWMMWALPDRCDANARELAKRSVLMGATLRYNQGGAAPQGGDAPPAPDAAPPPGPPSSTPPTSSALDQELSRPAPASEPPAGDNSAGYPAAKP